jgi:hypothetical protein
MLADGVKYPEYLIKIGVITMIVDEAVLLYVKEFKVD